MGLFRKNRNFSPLQRWSMAKFGSLMILAVAALAVAHEAAAHSTMSKSLVLRSGSVAGDTDHGDDPGG